MVSSIFDSLGIPAGDEPLCIDFTNTVGARRSSNPNEHLASPDDLGKWLANRRLVPTGADIDENYRVRALELRDAVYRLLSDVAAQKMPADDDLEVLNSELCEAMSKLELKPNLAWNLSEPNATERALMLISLSAVDLLSSPQSQRVRECADAACGWLFLDHSKNRSRRWCSMSDCGNLAKARRFQERHRERKTVIE